MKEGKLCILFELLASLTQEQRAVEEYVEHFELLMTQVDGIPKEQMLGYFLSGLKDEIRWRVRTFGPTTIIRAIELACLIEEDMMGDEMGPKTNKGFQLVLMVYQLQPKPC